MDLVKYVLDNKLGNISCDMSFEDITSIGCGGKIRFVYFPENIEALATMFLYLQEHNIKNIIVGNGTNILASDDFYDGVVIYPKNIASSYEIYKDYLVCSAFYSSSKLANELAKLKIGDLSFLAGIPGLIGGAIKQNSGAYQDEIANHLIEVKYIDQAGKIRVKKAEDMLLSYRYSIFHDVCGLIIEAKFKITQNVATSDRISERAKKRHESQPLSSRNMGSVFKNPGVCQAWEIIDRLHLRGFKLNDAAISVKHANFIINLGNAKTKDILEIIKLIQSRSKDELGVIMDYEVNIIE